MSDFIEVWDDLFSERTKTKVVEILEEDETYFSVENIYNLSMMGYDEEGSLNKDRSNQSFSIFDTPVSWIHSMLEPPETNNSTV